MKNILICATLFLMFCFPAMGQGAPDPESAQLVAIENLKKKLDEAKSYSKSHNYAEEIKIIEQAVTAAEPVLGPAQDDILKSKLFLAVAHINNKEPEKAYDILRYALADCRQGNKENEEITTAIKAVLINVIFTSGKDVAESPLLNEVLIGSITYFPRDEQPIIFFHHSTIIAVDGKLKKAAFFAKIWLGVESFFLHSPTDNGQKYEQILKVEGIIEAMQSQLHLPLDVNAALALLKRPNKPGETPYSKAQELMSSSEDALCNRFSLLATALNEAGKVKNDKKIKELTHDFQRWLFQVDHILD